jgi:L-alanine-DL-glutamate epimerase-like enolase superfamily enzyme
MRLAEHRLYTYRLRYQRPVRWSDIVEEAAPFVVLRLISDEGHVGVAEITVKPTWCGVTARSLIASVEDIFVPLLAKLDLSDPATLRDALDAVPENNAAKTLIDNACWDLHAAAHRTPLWRLWGGERRVDLSWAVTRQAPAAMAAEAATAFAR